MNLTTIGIIGVILMLGLMFLRMPIGIAMAVVGFVGFSYIKGWDQGLSIIKLTAYRTASTYVMTTLPLFMFMGVLAGYTGLSRDAFYTTNKWLGHLPGGLAMATVGGCAGFGAVCGSAVATAATMCTVTLPEMRRYKYADQLSLSTIASSGGLGFMIPPSGAFIVYAFLTEESIGSLFIAGILPGLLITFLFMAAIYITCRRNPGLGPAAPRANWKERLKALSGTWGILVLFLLVLGGMYGGIFTPTEAGAVGAFGTLILGLAKRRLTWKSFIASFSEAGWLTGMVLLLLVGAYIFNYFAAITKIPFLLAEFVSVLPVPPIIVLLAILVVFIILGFVIDIIPLMVLIIPMIYPALLAMSIDPVWFGVLCVLTMMIGLITPPLGIAVYTVNGIVKDVPMFTIFRGVWPFLYAMLIALALLVAFPQISLFLPNLMKPG